VGDWYTSRISIRARSEPEPGWCRSRRRREPSKRSEAASALDEAAGDLSNLAADVRYFCTADLQLRIESKDVEWKLHLMSSIPLFLIDQVLDGLESPA